MSTKILPSILKIEFLPAEELIISPRKIIVPGDAVKAIGQWTNIEISEPASANIVDEKTDDGIIYTTTINGIIKDDDNKKLYHRLSSLFHVYRITDVYKNKYLIGIDKKPYPEINFSPVNDASPGGIRAINFSIIWISTLPPIDIVN